MSQLLYHGTRSEFVPGSHIAPHADTSSEPQEPRSRVLLTPTLDEAVWSAELADGDGAPRVYIVEATGPVAELRTLSEYKAPGHPAMSWYSHAPIRVVREFSEWRYYHGTRAALSVGEVLKPGHNANFGDPTRSSNYIYFARTLDAATWGAELALGDGAERIYVVEPTGPIEDDPNLTNKRFRGNPTKSFRSRSPIRVIGEVSQWTPHPPELIHAMKQWLADLAQRGEMTIDD